MAILIRPIVTEKMTAITELSSQARKKKDGSYAIQADKSTTPPTYTVFFKAKNVDVIDSMLKQFTKKQLEKGEKKKREPVIKPKLEKYKAKVKAAGAKKSKTKTKQKVR